MTASSIAGNSRSQFGQHVSIVNVFGDKGETVKRGLLDVKGFAVCAASSVHGCFGV